jgi:pantoate--beta-alanine ligase
MNKPKVANTVEEVRQRVLAARRQSLSVGLVPTMGALHTGHASLIRAARAETGFVAVSIFVNPTQFGPGEDLGRYPRSMNEDLELCARERVELVFAPDAVVMYPAGFQTVVEVSRLQEVLCGPSRPGHFRGVATVVLKLFNIVQPDIAYFGQKDFQQTRIIEQMVRDLDVSTRLRVCPIVREPDGLALSSRNRYLDPNQRRQAVALFQALDDGRRLIEAGERGAAIVRAAMIRRLALASEAIVDYAEVVDADNLRHVDPLRGRLLLALAVKFGATRLIDNAIVEI